MLNSPSLILLFLLVQAVHPHHGFPQTLSSRASLQTLKRVSIKLWVLFSEVLMCFICGLWMFLNGLLPQLPAVWVGGSSRFVSRLQSGSDAEFTLSGSSSGQQQRLWTLPAAVRGKFPQGEKLSPNLRRQIDPELQIQTLRRFICSFLRIPWCISTSLYTSNAGFRGSKCVGKGMKSETWCFTSSENKTWMETDKTTKQRVLEPIVRFCSYRVTDSSEWTTAFSLC